MPASPPAVPHFLAASGLGFLCLGTQAHTISTSIGALPLSSVTWAAQGVERGQDATHDIATLIRGMGCHGIAMAGQTGGLSRPRDQAAHKSSHRVMSGRYAFRPGCLSAFVRGEGVRSSME
jgi:hypothetical protein